MGHRLVEQTPEAPIDEEAERRRVGAILVRLGRYTRGYLKDSKIQTIEDLSDNPLKVTVKVWLKNQRD